MSDLGQRDILLTITSLLAKYKITYLLSGSLAVSYYGYPRGTHDIDLVIHLEKNNFQRLIKLVKDLGEVYFYQEESIKEAFDQLTQFNIYHLATGIKVDFWFLKNDEFSKNKLKRIKEIIINRKKISIISSEDLILTKLLWCKEVTSERHLRDCTGILNVQKNAIDLQYLSFWVKKLKLENLLREVKEIKY